jgi:hypothetical protein
MRKNGGEAGLVDGSMLSASYDKGKEILFLISGAGEGSSAPPFYPSYRSYRFVRESRLVMDRSESDHILQTAASP